MKDQIAFRELEEWIGLLSSRKMRRKQHSGQMIRKFSDSFWIRLYF